MLPRRRLIRDLLAHGNRAWRAFAAARHGNVTMVTSAALPIFAGLATLGVDFAAVAASKQHLQEVADAAAIAAARELGLRSTSEATISAVVSSFVEANAPDLEIADKAEILSGREGVRVSLTAELGGFFAGLTGVNPEVRVEAVARLTAELPICVIGLNASDSKTVGLDKFAKISAPGCAVYSNSTHTNGLSSKDSAVLRAGLICSAGGKEGRFDNFDPEPVLDCPTIDDPLASRHVPTVGACDFTDHVISGGTATLTPGVYCGGIKIEKSARVTAARGVYVIKDGKLDVTDGGQLVGEYVTFQVVGDSSEVLFEPDSTIDLIASRDGDLAGFLIFGDAKASGQTMSVNSNAARRLLGTIYLPGGKFSAASHSPIADRSAYTVIVADKIELSQGPELVLNADYSATDVPVPDGVGPQGRTAYLAE